MKTTTLTGLGCGAVLTERERKIRVVRFIFKTSNCIIIIFKKAFPYMVWQQPSKFISRCYFWRLTSLQKYNKNKTNEEKHGMSVGLIKIPQQTCLTASCRAASFTPHLLHTLCSKLSYCRENAKQNSKILRLRELPPAKLCSAGFS